MTDHLTTLLQAIADPTRRAILAQLTHGPKRVTAVAEPFAMSLNAVSKHIKVLEEARLVTRTRHGREHTLELDAAPLREVVRWTSSFERFWNDRLDRLEAMLRSDKAKATTKKDPSP